MQKSFPVYFTVEQLELIDKCLWQTSESIDLGIYDCDPLSEIAQAGLQDISDIKKISDKICKALVRIRVRK